MRPATSGALFALARWSAVHKAALADPPRATRAEADEALREFQAAHRESVATPEGHADYLRALRELVDARPHEPATQAWLASRAVN